MTATPPCASRPCRGTSSPSVWRYIRSDHIAGQYDRHFADYPLFALDQALLEQWFEPPGRLIDLGCGTGRHALAFSGRGFDVTGVDLSEHMLSRARSKLADAGLPARWIHSDICDLPESVAHPAEPFNYALCMFSTLGLIRTHAQRARFVRSVYDLLAHGGAFALHVHNRGFNFASPDGPSFLLGMLGGVLTRRRQWGDKVLGNYRGISNMVVHVFSERELVGLLRDAGFIVRHCLALNARRNGLLKGRFLRSIRANGYIVLAVKPS